MNLKRQNKKRVIFHPACTKDFRFLPEKIRNDFLILFTVLEKEGYLREPYAKKLKGHKNLFELRVLTEGNWRLFYGYLLEDIILMTHLVNKKTQKTNKKDINLTLKRLKDYENQK